MTHWDEGRLQALMDGELAGDETAEVQRHLEACDACRSRYEALEDGWRSVSAALEALDPTPPTERVRERVRAEAARRKAAVPAAAAAGAPRAIATARGWRRALAAEALPRAAVVTLLLAGGVAAAALPGSPIRQWLVDETPAPQPAAAPAADATLPAPPEEVGVRVSPAQGRVRIVVDGLPPGAELTVTRLGAAEVAAVYAPDGARFRSGTGLLEVETSRGPVRVELPAGVVSSLVVGGRVYVEGDAAGWETPGPALERSDDRVRFRVN